jgi:hypothetical protein
LTSIGRSGVDRQLRGESPLVSRARFAAPDVSREVREFVQNARGSGVLDFLASRGVRLARWPWPALGPER